MWGFSIPECAKGGDHALSISYSILTVSSNVLVVQVFSDDFNLFKEGLGAKIRTIKIDSWGDQTRSKETKVKLGRW